MEWVKVEKDEDLLHTSQTTLDVASYIHVTQEVPPHRRTPQGPAVDHWDPCIVAD